MATETTESYIQHERYRSPADGGCRFCAAPLETTFVDLGMMPLAQNFRSANQLDQMEAFYPLHAFVCSKCLLVQLKEYVSPVDIFCDYAYFSSYSSSWLAHAERFCREAVRRFDLTAEHQVVEIASNDGYLLQYLVEAGIPVLGIEPAMNVARVANEKGIPTLNQFFNTATAKALVADGVRADLLIGNNVLAHVPDLHELVEAMKIVLADHGVISMEFPHLARLIEQNQFDTIYHEHYSYFSFLVVQKVFAAHGLMIFDVEHLPTHGGSLRIFARHADDGSRPVLPSVHELMKSELASGYDRIETYRDFTEKVARTKRQLLSFLIQARNEGKTVVGYGAPAKANTLLNYCGIRADLLEYTVDRSPHKTGTFLPGTHIPVYDVSRIAETQPDYVLILPWNLKTEIMDQLAYARDWQGRFVVPIPELTVL